MENHKFYFIGNLKTSYFVTKYDRLPTGGISYCDIFYPPENFLYTNIIYDIYETKNLMGFIICCQKEPNLLDILNKHSISYFHEDFMECFISENQMLRDRKIDELLN